MEIKMPCPICHKSFTVQAEEIHPNHSHACPHYGTVVKFEGQDLSKVQESIDELKKELGDASVKVNFKVREPRSKWQFWKK